MSGKFKKSSIYFDEKPIKGSNNAVTSDGIAKAIEAGGGGGVTVDNELSVVSENPVQNKVITNKINDMETDIYNIEEVIPSGATTSNKLATARDIPDVTSLETRIGTAETDIDNIEAVIPSGATTSNKLATTRDVQGNADKIGNLTQLQTTVKTDLVSAINEVASGSGGGGVKYRRFSSKQTTGTISISGATYVTYTESSIKTWFDSAPNTICAIIAFKMAGNVVRVAINSGTSFIMEQTNNPVTYDFVGVFYE